MKCKQTVALFDAYMNGTISPAEKQELENHLKTCENCKKQLELYHFYFSDVNIENDFPVPAQLNAKIQYTLQQARVEKEEKESKKIPFWQNKRILSAATACAFLFVASILGVSNYEKLQNASKTHVVVETPVRVSNETVTQPPEQTPSPTVEPVIAKESRQTPQVSAVSEPVLPQNETAMLSDTNEDIAAYSAEENTTPAPDDAQDESATPFHLQRTVVPAEDVTLPVEFKDSILLTYPYEIISEDVFLVAVTQEELETVLGYPLDTAEPEETEEATEPKEPKDQLFIRFTTTEE